MSLCTVHNHTINLILQHMVYPFMIRRHWFLDPWTRGYVISQLVYWGLTLSCTGIEARTLVQASSRAGTLATIQLVPLFFGDHLSFAADLMDLSLHMYWQLHSSIGIMTLILATFHVIITLSNQQQFSFQDDLQLYGFIMSASGSRWSKLLMLILGGSLLDCTVSILLLDFPENVLQGFPENPSDSDFDCGLRIMASSFSQEAFCTYLCGDCHCSFYCNNGLEASADSFLKLCPELRLCSGWCDPNQQHGQDQSNSATVLEGFEQISISISAFCQSVSGHFFRPIHSWLHCGPKGTTQTYTFLQAQNLISQGNYCNMLDPTVEIWWMQNIKSLDSPTLMDRPQILATMTVLSWLQLAWALQHNYCISRSWSRVTIIVLFAHNEYNSFGR